MTAEIQSDPSMTDGWNDQIRYLHAWVWAIGFGAIIAMIIGKMIFRIVGKSDGRSK